MPDLTSDDIQDLITTTQKNLGKPNFTQISTTLQRYVMMGEILREKRVTFQSGTHIQWQVMHDESSAAQHQGKYAVDNPNVDDVMTTAEAPWRLATTNYSIERGEVTENRNPQRIVDLVKVRRIAAMVSLAKELENKGWSKPADSTNKTDPFGIPYWIVKNASTGFNGGNPTGFSDGAGGLDSTSKTRWQNYTAQYTDVSKTDLVRKWREAATKTEFMAPVPHPSHNTGNQYAHYTNYNVLGTLEELLEAQNDNLGNDVASKDGRVMFRQNPVIWVPKLEDDSQDPVYGINWGEFKVAVKANEFMVETPAIRAPNQHRVFSTFVDLSYNYICYNRRSQFVLATA